MTDDLRTRAERAAAVEYMEFSSDDFETRAQTAALRAAFIDGVLWHADQQPTREQIAQTQRDLMFCADHVGNGAFEDDEDDPCEDCWRHRYDIADAVLALLNGAGS